MAGISQHHGSTCNIASFVPRLFMRRWPKKQSFRVHLDGPAVVWCDNKSVANGASVPAAKLNKKHLGICYHAVREASAAKVWMVGFTHGKHNIADMLTKILSGNKKEGQAGKWMHGR